MSGFTQTNEMPRASDDSSGILLDPIETRVLAVMAEKEALTPDIYPLSLNALTNGCNQLTSRDPVMKLSEAEVQEALDRVIARKLAAEVRQAGARVVKFEHRMRIHWTLEQDKLAVLVILMLRGPQTASEIRSRAGRMHEFSTTELAEGALQFLMDKFPSLVIRLARVPGTKEARYMHTLSGTDYLEHQECATSTSRQAISGSDGERIAKLESDVEQLRSELLELRDELSRFRKQFD